MAREFNVGVVSWLLLAFSMVLCVDGAYFGRLDTKSNFFVDDDDGDVEGGDSEYGLITHGDGSGSGQSPLPDSETIDVQLLHNKQETSSSSTTSQKPPVVVNEEEEDEEDEEEGSGVAHEAAGHHAWNVEHAGAVGVGAIDARKIAGRLSVNDLHEDDDTDGDEDEGSGEEHEERLPHIPLTKDDSHIEPAGHDWLNDCIFFFKSS